jgi:hypothetical protein
MAALSHILVWLAGRHGFGLLGELAAARDHARCIGLATRRRYISYAGKC